MEYPCCLLGSADSHITPSHGSAEGGAIFFPHSYDDDDVGDDGDDGDAGDGDAGDNGDGDDGEDGEDGDDSDDVDDGNDGFDDGAGKKRMLSKSLRKLSHLLSFKSLF